MLRPTREHHLIIKEEGEEVYRKIFLSFNDYLDEDFYKNLNLELDKEDSTLKETEINFQEFFVEWWRYIAQRDIFKNIAVDMQIDICLTDKKEIVSRLMSFKHTSVGKFFSILEDMKKFICKNDRIALDNKYKMYMEIKYNIENIERYKKFYKN